MTVSWKKVAKRLLFLPPLAIGIAAVVIAVKTREAPERVPPAELAKHVRVIAAPRTTVVPRAVGYGTVQPAKVWEAIAQISGKIAEIHPQLKNGAILPEGTVILRIDAADYELAIQRIEADIRAARASILELETREENTRASLAIENRVLELTRKDLARKKELAGSRAVSEAAVDQEERNLLSRRQSVQNLQNALNLFPAERQRLEAQLATAQVQLADARLDLERTAIALPFDARIARVNVERTQVATAGQVLAIADSIDVAEVTAQVPVERMLRLIAHEAIPPFDAATAMADIANLLKLDPVVRLRSGEVSVTWRGRVARVSDTVDPSTRTVGVIVAVDRPYGQATAETRPPLAKNMYVEVELRGTPRRGEIVVPRTALHDGRVYIVGAGDRLVVRPVAIRFTQGNVALVESGLAAGERVVVSDLLPAIEGMKLVPEFDDSEAAALIEEAGGGTRR
jgi:multidrug efflux pump subunit AcrA (membrane-fusion protein)